MRTRPVLLGILLLLPAIVVAGTWEPTITVGGGGNAFDPPPLIAVSDGGEAVVGWSAGVARVATRTTNGAWSAAVDLGTISGGTEKMALAIAADTGEALTAWWDGSAVRTATRPAGGTWTVATGTGTWTLHGSAAVRVLAGMSASGAAAVAWEQSGTQAGVYVALQDAGGWSDPIPLAALSGLSHGTLLRAADGGIVIATDSGGVTLLRRDPTGIVTTRAFGSGRIEGSGGATATGTFAVGAYLGSDFSVIEGSLATLATTVRQHVAAVRPGLQTFSRAGGAALQPVTGQPAAAWIDSTGTRRLVGAAAIAGTWQTATLATGLVTSATTARTRGDESVVVYTNASDPFGVLAIVRSPCTGATWSNPIPLDTASNYGAVGVGAGGRTAVGSWIDVAGNVRAAVFDGDPPSDDLVCDTPYALPTDDVGCASGQRAALTDQSQFPDVAVCAGAWSGHVSNGLALCGAGWAVCAAGDPALQEVTFTDARSFDGCYLYDASEDFDVCSRCTGDNAHDDMAGLGFGCNAYVVPGAGSCLAGGGRNEAACCSDAGSGTACQYKPDLTSGAVCCRAVGAPTTSSTSTSSTTTTATSETTTSTTSTSVTTTSTTTASTSTTTTTLRPCTVTSQCDDGDACNGAEVCQAGFCRTPAQATCTPAGALAVVPRYDDDAVDVVQLASGSTLGSVDVGHGPWAVAWSPDGRHAYVTDRLGDAVSVVDVGSRKTIATVAVPGQPLGVAVQPSTGRVYVSAHERDVVAVVDPVTATVIDTIAVGDGPAGLAFDPSGAWLYVADYRDDTVAVVDTAAARMVSRIAVPRQPITVAVHPDGGKVYVACYSDAAVSVIGTASRSQVARLRVGRQPTGIAFGGDGRRAFVACGGDETIAVVDAVADRVVGKHALRGFPFGVASDPSTTAVWVTRTRAGLLSRLDGDTAASQLDVAVASTPAGIGHFIGLPADDCPAQPLSCDDHDPFTLDACAAATGCAHDPLVGLSAAAAGAVELRGLSNGLTTPDGAVARRLRAALAGLEAAVARATQSGTAEDRALVRRDLGRVIRTLQSSADRGALAPSRSRLLDLARGVQRRLAQNPS